MPTPRLHPTPPDSQQNFVSPFPYSPAQRLTLLLTSISSLSGLVLPQFLSLSLPDTGGQSSAASPCALQWWCPFINGYCPLHRGPQKPWPSFEFPEPSLLCPFLLHPQVLRFVFNAVCMCVCVCLMLDNCGVAATAPWQCWGGGWEGVNQLSGNKTPS